MKDILCERFFRIVTAAYISVVAAAVLGCLYVFVMCFEYHVVVFSLTLSTEDKRNAQE